jgi:hypothetical protein
MSREIIRTLPTASSNDLVWMAWYDALKKQFGKKKANGLFTSAWDSQLATGGDANTTTLRQHLNKEGGIDISGGFWGEVKDKYFDVGNFFGDYLVMGKYLGIGLGVIVVGGLGLLVYNLAKDPEKAVRVGSAIATRGMSEGIPKK